MNAARVLVTGVGGPAGRSVVAQLLARGLSVVGVDMAPAAIPEVEVARVPAATDPRFRRTLAGIAGREHATLIIPTVTEELVVLARHGSDARIGGIPVVISARSGVNIAHDKWLTCKSLDSAGISIPRFGLPAQLRIPSLRLGLPFLSKPRVGRGSRGVTVHTEPAGSTTARLDSSTILQEFIPGTEYGPNLYLARDPANDVVVALEKTALAHGRVGNAVAVRRVAAVDVARLARDAARAIGLTGPVDVDVRRRRDGAPVVLEINARFGANSHHAPEVLDALLAEHLNQAVSAA